jgi:molybdate transport system substrate-binding protein
MDWINKFSYHFGCVHDRWLQGLRRIEAMSAKREAASIRLWLCACVALLALAVSVSACHAPRRVTLTLSVAASVKDAIVDAEAVYQRDHSGLDFRNNFGSSGTLAREIEEGAPVDAFLSAASSPMDDLEAKGLVAPGTRRNLLRNSLVLIAPRDSRLRDFEGLTDPSVRLIALGDPASVPAGQYGRQALAALHFLDRLNKKFVMGGDVRQVLTYVETGNADAGLVYATDAQISGRVRIVAVAPDSTHDPILYPAAVIKTSQNGVTVRNFIEYLSSPEAQAIFAKHGFTIASP